MWKATAPGVIINWLFIILLYLVYVPLNPRWIFTSSCKAAPRCYSLINYNPGIILDHSHLYLLVKSTPDFLLPYVFASVQSLWPLMTAIVSIWTSLPIHSSSSTFCLFIQAQILSLRGWVGLEAIWPRHFASWKLVTKLQIKREFRNIAMDGSYSDLIQINKP